MSLIHLTDTDAGRDQVLRMSPQQLNHIVTLLQVSTPNVFTGSLFDTEAKIQFILNLLPLQVAVRGEIRLLNREILCEKLEQAIHSTGEHIDSCLRAENRNLSCLVNEKKQVQRLVYDAPNCKQQNRRRTLAKKYSDGITKMVDVKAICSNMKTCRAELRRRRYVIELQHARSEILNQK